jgi:hypothetical protein
MRRLVARRGVAACHAPHGEDGDPDAERGGRYGAGEEDPSRVAQLTAGRVADRRDEVLKRPVARQSRGEASLETRASGERAERRSHRGSSIDQGHQVRPNGGMASGQKAIDGLIQAFGRGAGWQAGSPQMVRQSSS